MLDTVTYRDEDVISMVGKMISVKINGKKDTVMSNMHAISGYPTIILAKADGTEIDRIWGYVPPEDFLATINDYLADKNTLGDYIRRAAASDSVQLFGLIADKYTGRKKYTESETYYRKILQADPGNKLGYSDSALYNMGQMKTRAKQFTGARETFERLTATYPESGLIDDAAFASAASYSRAEKYDKAVEGFKAFITAYPESELIPDAETYIPYILVKDGKKEEALKLYEQFLVKYPDSPEVNWIKTQIEKINNPPKEESGK